MTVQQRAVQESQLFSGVSIAAVGRASMVLGTDQTTATAALPARAVQVHKVMRLGTTILCLRINESKNIDKMLMETPKT